MAIDPARAQFGVLAWRGCTVMSKVTWDGWGSISILDVRRSRPAGVSWANIRREDYVSACPEIASEKPAERRRPATLEHAGV